MLGDLPSHLVDEVPDLTLVDTEPLADLVHIVRQRVVLAVDSDQDAALLGGTVFQNSFAGLPVDLIHIALESGGSFGVAAIEPQTVIDIFCIKGSSAHINYLLS